MMPAAAASWTGIQSVRDWVFVERVGEGDWPFRDFREVIHIQVAEAPCTN